MGRDVDVPGRRLPRAERREQILTAATQAFAHAGFTATGLDDVAETAGISRAILYRHFDSKTDLYRAVLGRARQHLHDAVGAPPYSERIIDDLLAAAAGDPAGFRLLFHHAGREPEFRADIDRFGADMVAMAHDHLATVIPDPDWARWAAHLAPTSLPPPRSPPSPPGSTPANPTLTSPPPGSAACSAASATLPARICPPRSRPGSQVYQK